ncbi:iron ABC transporter permease [Pseudonocardiaceae bacterium YIM PH 21723]|nr:iron ABC transporter permease [Pseudonocardiaceae bacterium YIM PH 21723]
MSVVTADRVGAAPPGSRKAIGLVAGVVLLLAAIVLSIAVGSRWIPPAQIWNLLLHPDDGELSAIVNGLRVPRTILGLAAGAALAVSGAVMQGLTRNPLGDPSLLGTSAGAGFGVIVSLNVIGLTSFYSYIWFGFAGALIATVLVYYMASIGRGGPTPVKLALSGAAIQVLFISMGSTLLLLNRVSLERYRFWLVGALTGVNMSVVLQVLPVLLIGLVLALLTAPGLNALALGDDVATSLGRNVGLIRIQGALAVTLLTGAATAVCGPIVFVGLVIPHAVRQLTGVDNRWVIAYSTLYGSVLLLLADILGRIVARPVEVQVGIVVAFVGVPFFIALIRRRRLAEL